MSVLVTLLLQDLSNLGVCVSSARLPEGFLMPFVGLEYCYLLSLRDKERVCICNHATVEYSAVVHWFVFHLISWLFMFKKPCWKHGSRSVRQIIYGGAKSQ